MYRVSGLQFCRNIRELFQGRLQVVDDFLGEDIGVGQVVGFFQGFVKQPEDVEVGIVSLQHLVVFVATPAAFGSFFRPDAIAAIGALGVVAFDELVQVGSFQRVGLSE